MRPEAFNKYPGSLRYRAGPVRERSGWSADHSDPSDRSSALRPPLATSRFC